MSLSYSTNINAKPYHNNDENFLQQQAPTYTPFIQEVKPESNTKQSQQYPTQYPQQYPMQYPPQYPMQYPPHPSQYSSNKYEQVLNPPSVSNNKINWMSIFKSISIYLILFLIISSVKMDELLFKLIPYLHSNEIIKMIIKGLILSIVIVIIQKIVT